MAARAAAGPFYNWKKGDVGQAAHSFDLASRISYVLIFKALELYQRPEMADAWVPAQCGLRRPVGWSGCAGPDLAVRDYLDNVRGG